jgi:hypothetical protein
MAASIPATIVHGHRVASGQNGDPRFPGGTIRMQAPHFLALGLDLSPFYPGTLNVSVAPFHLRIIQPRLTLRSVPWHPTEPAEDFSFFDVELLLQSAAPVSGLIYYPHPETKPEHFQGPDVIELLLPWTEGLHRGGQVVLAIPPEQMVFEL